MMLFFLSIVFGLVSVGKFQDIPIEHYDLSPAENIVPQPKDQYWPLQYFQQYYGHLRRSSNQVPCPKRKSSDDDNWIPTFTAKVMKPLRSLQTHGIQPQSLTDSQSQTTEGPIDDVKTKVDHFFDKIRDSVDHIADGAKNIEGKLNINNPTEEKDPSKITTHSAEARLGETMEQSMEQTMEQPLQEAVEAKMEQPSGQHLETIEETNEQPMEENVELPVEQTKEDKVEHQSSNEVNHKKIHHHLNILQNLNRNAKPEENKDQHADDHHQNDGHSKELDSVTTEKELPKSNDAPKSTDTPVKCPNNEPTIDAKRNLIGAFLNSRRSMTNAKDEKVQHDLPTGVNKIKNFNNFLAHDTDLNRAATNTIEPTDGPGMSDMSDTRVMLMKNSRVCYACSTASNPTCWTPDRKTTVKYCNKEHESCVTKTFGAGSTLTLIRDCANSCTDSDIPGFSPKYKACSLCHSDLCNGGFSINSQSLIFAFFLLAAVKSMS